jgi:hypothetical protein
MYFVPSIVIQLRKVNQQNAHFSNQCFNSMLGVFFLFPTSCVQHQEDHLYMTVLNGIFFVHLCKQSSSWKDVLECVGLNLNCFSTQFTYVIFENCFMEKRCF